MFFLFHARKPRVLNAKPLRALLSVIQATPMTESVSAEALSAFHTFYKNQPQQTELRTDPQVLAKGLAEGLPAHSMAIMELLFVLECFDLVLQAGEKLYARYPMDHRIQDTVFRASYYKQIGRVDEHPGREHRGVYCPMLWKSAHIQPNGDVHQCCSVWLRTPIGNIFTDPIDRIWMSARAERIRKSAIDGDYRYCGKVSCLHLQWHLFNDPAAQNTFWLDAPPSTYSSPTHLNLSYDQTCNLICPSCRNEPKTAKGKQLEKIEKVTTHLVPTLKGAERVEITGSGDPFASKSFRRLMSMLNRTEYPKLKLTLMTNGLLVRRTEWERFQHLHGMIDTFKVSVDAAQPETYAVLRRGGELKDLIPNLEFIGELRRQNAIDEFVMCFVVQYLNFREMPAFVDLARGVGADRVHFQMLHDWGTYRAEDQKQRQIHLREHPEHQAFLDILKSLGDIQSPTIVSDFSYLLGTVPP